MERNEVAVAFDMVLQEIDRAIAALNQEGAEAFQSGRYEMAKNLTEKGAQMKGFRDKVAGLRKEWHDLFAAMVPKRAPRKKKKAKQSTERLKAGLKTWQDAFRIPILQVLVELGGSAPIREVLDKVGERMRGQLNQYDRQPLSSDPKQVRWRNTAQWARNAMVKEGLLMTGSPRGIWEIAPAGRRWLATAGKK